MDYLFIILLFFLLCGCTTYSKCPDAPHMKKLDLPIWRLKPTSTNSEVVKAVVESNKICVTHDAECYNYLEDYMRKE